MHFKDQRKQTAAPEAPPSEVNIGAKGDMRPGSRVEPDLAHTVLQGMTLGASDEINAGLMTPLMALTDGMPLGEAYQQAKARENSILAATRDAYPKASVAAELTGAITTAPGKAIMQAPGLLKKAAVGAGVSALQGGIYGFNTGEGLGDRLKDARTGAVFGGLAGAALPAGLT